MHPRDSVHQRWLLAAALPLCLTPNPGSAQPPLPAPGALRFVAIGDMPYSPEEKTALENQITQAIRASRPPFVVHYGDIKNGKSDCDNRALRLSLKTVYQLLPGRVIYTPGDNEWTDCDRANLAHPRSELERLDLIRRTLYAQTPGFPHGWDFKRQANFPENARWSTDGVLFTTVHWVGTNNGRREILQDDSELALAMVEAREQANRVWLQQAFELARAGQARALVLVTQADVTLERRGPECTSAERSNCDAFAGFRRQLQRLASDFGAKPVLLVHGDTQPYCWDKGFGGDMAPNLWRLNAWGDYQTPPDATEIAVQPEHRRRPFSARTLIQRRLPAESCD